MTLRQLAKMMAKKPMVCDIQFVGEDHGKVLRYVTSVDLLPAGAVSISALGFVRDFVRAASADVKVLRVFEL